MSSRWITAVSAAGLVFALTLCVIYKDVQSKTARPAGGDVAAAANAGPSLPAAVTAHATAADRSAALPPVAAPSLANWSAIGTETLTSDVAARVASDGGQSFLSTSPVLTGLDTQSIPGSR